MVDGWIITNESSSFSLFKISSLILNVTVRRKREARAVHHASATAQKTFGIKAKLLHAKRHAEKVQLKKTLKVHDERNAKQSDNSNVPEGALPTYLLDRENEKNAKTLSTAIKQKRKDQAAKYAVPLPKVRGIAEEEIFKVMKTGKSRSKSWKRMVTKATFVGEGFTRKPVKMERFVRPMALRYKKANVTHREFLQRLWSHKSTNAK
jgi:ribosome biogenesis protein NSA2